MVLPEMLNETQVFRPLECLRWQAFLVQDQEISFLNGVRDLVDRACEAETPLIVRIELTERRVGGVGAVEPHQVDIKAGKNLSKRQSNRFGRGVLLQ